MILTKHLEMSMKKKEKKKNINPCSATYDSSNSFKSDFKNYTKQLGAIPTGVMLAFLK